MVSWYVRLFHISEISGDMLRFSAVGWLASGSIGLFHIYVVFQLSYSFFAYWVVGFIVYGIISLLQNFPAI